MALRIGSDIGICTLEKRVKPFCRLAGYLANTRIEYLHVWDCFFSDFY